MHLDSYNYTSGKNDGSKVLFLGAIHGNEIAGTKAILKLKSKLDNGEITLKKGVLTMMPICNPLAHKKDVRFINKNLNRIISNYDNPSDEEEQYACEVADAISSCDYLIDFHSTHSKGDKPFAFLDYPTDNNKLLVASSMVRYVLTNWPDIYEEQDTLHDFSTEKFAQISGKSSITLECGYHKDIDAENIAFETMINVLVKLDMIDGKFIEYPKTYIKMQKVVIKDKNGQLSSDFNHLDIIKSGELIAVYSDGEEIRADADCYILIPNSTAEVGMEWFYLGV